MSEAIADGYLDAARSAGAHDEFVAYVAEYPESKGRRLIAMTDDQEEDDK